MRGYLILEGGAEFGGEMAVPDRRALALAGGSDAQVSIIPAAAAPDNNYERAGQTGVRWFEQLGARRVEWLRLIDRASADSAVIAAALRNSRFVYLLGGFPHYLEQTLAVSAGWQAILEAYREGAVIGGSSAGAMVLCRHYYDPATGSISDGLNLIPKACLIPHHNTFGKNWAPQLIRSLPEEVIVGIDEETAMIDDGPADQWNVYGKGVVTLYRGGRATIYPSGGTFPLREG
jgi:cyanophycinase